MGKNRAMFLFFFTDQDQGHLKGNPDLWIIDQSWMQLLVWWILHLSKHPNYFKRFDEILNRKKVHVRYCEIVTFWIQPFFRVPSRNREG